MVSQKLFTQNKIKWGIRIMEDFSKIAVIILGMLFLFYMPTLVISQKLDNSVQTYVDDCVQEFVNESRSTGYISTQNYLKMIEQLDNTEIIYNISITHSKRVVVPRYNDEGVFTGEYDVVYNDFFKDEIEAVLFYTETSESAYSVNNKYKMNNGDYLQVTIQNESDTFGTKILSFISSTGNGKKILTTYGGHVGNVAQ